MVRTLIISTLAIYKSNVSFIAKKFEVKPVKKVYQHQYLHLVNSLPMTDHKFLASLKSKELFTGDLENQVEARSTSAEKANHFLKEAVDKSLSIDILEKFDALLIVMLDYGDSTLKDLVKTIIDTIEREKNEVSKVD